MQNFYLTLYLFLPSCLDLYNASSARFIKSMSVKSFSLTDVIPKLAVMFKSSRQSGALDISCQSDFLLVNY